jgi:putative chitinase
MNLNSLKGVVPDPVIYALDETVKKFELNTPLRLAHFLAQCAHESGNFRVTRENLSYSSEGLIKIFPKYFPSIDVATHFAKQPEKIANKVYANRMGNGDEASGEGFKFRGRGYIQLTGKQNYTAFGSAIGVDVVSNPDLVASKYALLSAAWFFHKNALHKIADEGSADVVVQKITKRVNGGTIGLADRIKHFKEIYSHLAE